MLAPKLENKSEKSMNSNMELIPQQLSDKGLTASISELIPSAIPSEKRKLTQEEIQLLMSKIDFSGIKNWSSEEQQEVKDLIIEYGSLFALTDMDLG